jgi:hypothetical protein
MGRTFVFPTLNPGGGKVARMFSDDGKVWRQPALLGGVDPAGFVALSGAELAAGNYDIPLPEIVDSLGEYLFTVPDDTPAGAHSYRAYDGSDIVAIATLADVGYWNGEDFETGFIAEDRISLETILGQSLLIGAVPASFPAMTGSVFDPTGADTAVYWSQAFIGAGQDITGWTRLVFTLKDNPAADDDGDALLTVRLSNPAATGTDGILVHNRRDVPAADSLRPAGIITVEAMNPAQVRATLLPAALQLPPSPDNLPYSFEWNWWDGAGIKHQIGRGDFSLARSVRRGVVAP